MVDPCGKWFIRAVSRAYKFFPDQEGKQRTDTTIPYVALFSLLVIFECFVVVESETNFDIHCEPGCRNNSTCTVDPATRTTFCLCPPPASGSDIYLRGASCQITATRCNDTWWCENGGQCQVAGGSTDFNCSCPLGFQGPKCQTPVTICGKGLWCANGGICELPMDSNETSCKCPSTHTGINCQTLVEPLDLGPSARELDTLGHVLPSSSPEEQLQYSRIFFGALACLLVVWGLTFTLVQYGPELSARLRAAGMHNERAAEEHILACGEHVATELCDFDEGSLETGARSGARSKWDKIPLALQMEDAYRATDRSQGGAGTEP